jgi:hypothetical protein
VNLYPNPTAPLIPLYPNSPVGENRSRRKLTCTRRSGGGGAGGMGGAGRRLATNAEVT